MGAVCQLANRHDAGHSRNRDQSVPFPQKVQSKGAQFKSDQDVRGNEEIILTRAAGLLLSFTQASLVLI